jgi:hypothetical protein
LEGDSLLSRIKYRKNASGLTYRKPAVAKNQKMIKQGAKASSIAAENKNEDFGF